MRTEQKLAGRIVAVGAILTAAAVLYFFNPTTAVFYPKCLFHEFTGFYCPGCGTTRALHALLHGEPGRALHENALAVLCLPVLGWFLLRWVLRRGPSAPGTLVRPAWVAVSVAVVVAFGVLRNVPARPFSWLAPPAEESTDSRFLSLSDQVVK